MTAMLLFQYYGAIMKTKLCKSFQLYIHLKIRYFFPFLVEIKSWKTLDLELKSRKGLIVGKHPAKNIDIFSRNNQ